jgi:hypothetical protein
MKKCTLKAKVFVSGVIICGFLQMFWSFATSRDFPLQILAIAILAGLAQILKVEGPTDRSNYNISWVFYGFSFLSFGAFGAMFVILIAHLMEWLWHKYSWHIQTFNIAVYAISVSLASSVCDLINPEKTSLNVLGALALFTCLALFTLINHFLVGIAIKLARGQSFAESGVFEGITLVVDVTLLGLGIGSAMIWEMNPYLALLNVIPVYLLHNALRVPALQRKIKELETARSDI